MSLKKILKIRQNMTNSFREIVYNIDRENLLTISSVIRILCEQKGFNAIRKMDWDN